ncbi:hypothetical protein QCA50_007789 [Cerrena zonata]|uniref:Uncharacterized protein n=1 Tax=Cerrena zonata TaxID=2478898 RepID=A0AAW0G6W4_9APHY
MAELASSGSIESQTKTEEVTAVAQTDLEADIPDGGLQAWLCVLGGWLVTFCTFGYAQSFGVYEDLYVLAGASTPSNVAWIGSFQLFMVFAMGLPAGKLFDAGYFHHIQIAGALLFVFSLFML